MEEKSFKASPDTASYVVTTLCLIAFLTCFTMSFHQEGWHRWLLAFVGLSGVVLPIFTVVDKVKKEGHILKLKKGFSSRIVDLNEYDVEYHYDDFQLSQYIRTFGSGGYWGWWGRWRRRSDGRKADSYLVNKNYNVTILTPKQGNGALILVNMPKEWVNG